jgi:nuclear transport factor 2 (NTF2) superfamily protein
VSTDHALAVRRFVEAFNDEDLDAFVAALAPDVEIQGSRGLVRGREEARAWATRRPSGELHQRLVLDDVRSDGHPTVALLRRQWAWLDGKVADETEFAALITFDDAGLISGYHPVADRGEALRSAGLEP